MVGELLELGTAQGADQVLRDAVDGHDVRQVDLGLARRAQLDLGLLGSFLQTLQGHRVLTQVDAAVVLHELLSQPVDDDFVEVVAAEVGVTVGGFHLEHAVAEFQDGDIEGAAAEVIDGHFGIALLLVQAVSQSGCCRFVDDTAHFQAGDLASFLGGLTL